MLITGLVCGTLGLLFFILGIIMAVGDSKWIPVAFLFFMMCFRIVELVVQYMMYGAINLHDTKRICLLIKWQLGMFLFG